MGLPIFRSALMEWAAYSELHLTGRVPRQDRTAAAGNVTAITAETLSNLERLLRAA